MVLNLTMIALLAATTIGPIVAVFVAGRRPGASRGRTLAWAGLAGALPMVAYTLLIALGFGPAAFALVPRLVVPGAMWGGIVGFLALFLRGRLGAPGPRA